MMRTDTKVGDVGTIYRVPTFDNDLAEVNFDPTSAVVKQIIFKMPGATGLLTRTATPAQVTIDSVAVWCLTYTVLAADVVAGGFHQEPGNVTLEGYVEFSAAQKWSSDPPITTDHQGRPLRVRARLSA